MKKRLPLIAFCFYFFLLAGLIYISSVTKNGGLITPTSQPMVASWLVIGYISLFFIGCGFITMVAICFIGRVGIYNKDFDGGKK